MHRTLIKLISVIIMGYSIAHSSSGDWNYSPAVPFSFEIEQTSCAYATSAGTLGDKTSDYFLNRDQTIPQTTTGTFHLDKLNTSTAAVSQSISISSSVIGTYDFYGRWQINTFAPDSVLRLGRLQDDGDATTVETQGIVAYGKNNLGDAMSGTSYSYARIKPNRIGLYTRTAAQTGYYWWMDYESGNDTWTVTNANGSPVFDFDRNTGGDLRVGNSISISTFPAVAAGVFQVGPKFFMVSSSETSAINRALQLGSTGCVVQILPTGTTWYLTSPINIDYDSVTIIGSNLSAMIVPAPNASWTSTVGHCIRSSGHVGINIKDVAIDGRYLAGNFDLINLGNCHTVGVVGCDVYNGPQHGIFLDGVGNSHCSLNRVKKCANTAIRVSGYWEGGGAYKYGLMNKVNNNNIDGQGACVWGIIVNYCTGNEIVGNVVNNVTNGINSPNGNTTLNMAANSITNSTVGIYLYASGAAIFGNNIYNAAQYGIDINGGITSCVVADNNIDTCGRDGIIVGNYSLCTTIGIYQNAIKNAGNTYNDINIVRGDDVTITNNSMTTITGRSERGIYLQSGSSITIAGNTITGKHDTCNIEVLAPVWKSRINHTSFYPSSIINNSTTTYTVFLSSVNNYGINTSSPYCTLDVDGCARFSKSISIATTTTCSEAMLVVGSITCTEYFKVGKAWHVYGGTETTNTTIDIVVKDTWYKVTNATENFWQGIEANGFAVITDSMVFYNPGDYAGILSVTCSGLANTDYRFRILNAKTGTQSGYSIPITTTGTGNTISLSFPLYFESALANDNYILQVQNTSNTNDVTIKNAIYYILYAHN